MGMFLRRGPAQRGTPIGELPVGTAIKLNVGGTPWEFLIVQQGLPGDIYAASCDGAWLLMKDIYENRQWNSSDSNSYKASTIHTYLGGTFLNLFDSNIQETIKRVKIPYVNGTGSSAVASLNNGLPCKVFLLSGYELGWTTSDIDSIPVDGAKLDYFDASFSGNPKRIANFNGEANTWWLRSPNTAYTSSVRYVNKNGGSNSGSPSGSRGIRPAFILPTEFLVTDDMLA